MTKKKSFVSKFEADESVRNGDKRKVYRWRDDVGTRGELRYVDKALLYVDHAYQRPAREGKVMELARSWWWMACGVIVVVQRRDGRLVVVDGQHRVLAAMKRSDVKDLPCIVFQSDEVEEEAQAFLDCNANRKPVTSVDKFRAKTMAGDRVAQLVETLVHKSGRSVSSASSASTVSCIGNLQKCANANWEALERIWPMILELCSGEGIHSHLVEALHYIECSLDASGESISMDPWRDRFAKAGYQELLRSARNSAALRGSGNSKSWALGMASVVNRGMRSNRLLHDKSE